MNISLTRKEIDNAIRNYVKEKHGVDTIGLQFVFSQESSRFIEDLITDLVSVNCITQDASKVN
jgi:hypothetical protein